LKKISLEAETYYTLSTEYKNTGIILQGHLDAFLDEVQNIVTNGSIEGPSAITLQEIETHLRQTFQQDLVTLTNKKGDITLNSAWRMEEEVDK
jgi:hypothetical protein